MFEQDFWGAARDLGGLAARGIAAWVVVAIPVIVILSRALSPVLRHLAEALKGSRKNP
jgi:hypothetical protein